MSETPTSLFKQFETLVDQMKAIKVASNANMSLSGLSDDIIAQIETPAEDGFKTISLSALSAYAFALGYEIGFKQTGASKLSAVKPTITLTLNPITPKVTEMTLGS